MPRRDAVIGAGFVGLALSYALARRGRAVVVFDSAVKPEGASVRDSGALWPIGLPSGPWRSLAQESVRIWREVLGASGTWHNPCGSLHVAYEDDERRVLEEFAADAALGGFACELLHPFAVRARQPRIRAAGLKAGLVSGHELVVNPRKALVRIPQWLTERWGVRFERGTRITSCSSGAVRAGRRSWPADAVWLAPGDDVHTLYPEELAAVGLRRGKLQMMRTAPVPWVLGPVLAAGLSLGHADGFRACPSSPRLRTRLACDWPAHTAAGVHVTVAQDDAGHLILGESHEYDEAVGPFDRPAVDDLILDYLATFLDVHPTRIIERWHAVTMKHPRDPYCVVAPEPGVTAVVGLGGHAMTLSFGLAEQVVASRLDV